MTLSLDDGTSEPEDGGEDGGEDVDVEAAKPSHTCAQSEEESAYGQVFQTGLSRHPLVYALDRPEDAVLASLYLDLEADRAGSAVVDGAFSYWLAGERLSDRSLITINNAARRRGLKEVHFVDGHSTDWSIRRGDDKACLRGRIIERLRDMKGAGPRLYATVVSRARIEAARLPPRDPLDFLAA